MYGSGSGSSLGLCPWHRDGEPEAQDKAAQLAPGGSWLWEEVDKPLLLPPATTLCGLSSGRHTPQPAPLPGIWGCLCRLLPRPGPLLRLGWPGLFTLHGVLQEVRTPGPWNLSSQTQDVPGNLEVDVILPWGWGFYVCSGALWVRGGWPASSGILQELSSSRRSRRQDVRHGNPIRQCRGFNSNGECLGVVCGLWNL